MKNLSILGWFLLVSGILLYFVIWFMAIVFASDRIGFAKAFDGSASICLILQIGVGAYLIKNFSENK